ncbi:MAG: pseudaminic acid cytidylyltransferase, partial [Piscirickettsiaceae bacterium CG18_big_fil_WC_8_21_14_2_50_44_103]
MKICVIPARGGSKRIPRKNIRSFLGKPVIAYPIEAAIASGLFDAVIVSTNDLEIAEVAQQYGAEVPFMRPESLSDDHTATAPVLIHAIEWYEAQGHAVEEMTNIYPSTPFITADLLQDGYQVWKAAQSPYCFAVSEFHSAPQRALKLSQQGRAVSLYPEFQQTRTQDLPTTFF